MIFRDSAAWRRASHELFPVAEHPSRIRHDALAFCRGVTPVRLIGLVDRAANRRTGAAFELIVYSGDDGRGLFKNFFVGVQIDMALLGSANDRLAGRYRRAIAGFAIVQPAGDRRRNGRGFERPRTPPAALHGFRGRAGDFGSRLRRRDAHAIRPVDDRDRGKAKTFAERRDQARMRRPRIHRTGTRRRASSRAMIA